MTAPRGYMSNAFPPEIWFEVLNPSSLSPSDMQNLSLSCGFLQEVTRPFVFRSLTFRPPKRGDRCPSPAHTSFSERLDFLSSDVVVPWVREVKIVWKQPDRSKMVECQEAYDILGAKLGRFIKMSKLHVERFALNGTHLHALSACPYLKHINLLNCPIEFSRHPCCPVAQRGVVELSFQDGASLNASWWSSFISPTATRTITATNYQPSMQLMEILASKPVMMQLRHLTLCCASPGSPHFVAALKQCPSLETIRFVGEDYYLPVISPEDTLLADIAPHLNAIRAGMECFPSYFVGRPLKDIEVTGDLNGDLVTERFISDLYEHYSNVTSLVLRVSFVSNNVLLLPLTKFKHLEEYRVEDRRFSNDCVKEICKSLSTTELPLSLRAIWVGNFENSQSQENVEESIELQCHLRRRFPSLMDVLVASASVAFRLSSEFSAALFSK